MSTIAILADHRRNATSPVRRTNRPRPRVAGQSGWRAAVAGADVRLRQRRADVLVWALRHGRVVSRPALDAILASAVVRGVPLERWQPDDVAALLWVEVPRLAERLELPLPDRFAETLWTALDAAADLGWLVQGRSRLAELQRPLEEFAGLDAVGRPRPTRRPHPSTQSATAPSAPSRRGRREPPDPSRPTGRRRASAGPPRGGATKPV